MIYTFWLWSWFFRGHALENWFINRGASAVGRITVGPPQIIEGSVPDFRHQSSHRLQMAGSLSCQGPSRVGQPFATSATLAKTFTSPMGSADWPLAPAATPLGAKKIHWRLRRDFPQMRVPCARTIHRWLGRLELLRAPRRRARRGPTLPYSGLTAATRPNQVWTVDFKGWFRTADGQRQEPLTVRDLFSRYGLCLRLLPNQDDRPVRRAMRRLFQVRGLPEIIRVDNGSPFAGKGALGFSRLSVWWQRLGIRVEFTRRARPGDNAAHEQFHGCYQREVVAKGAKNRRAMQRRSDHWLRDYNENRFHESLENRTPAECYRPSQRPYRPAAPWPYPPPWPVRRVRNRGHIKWQGRLRFIGRAFVGQQVGLQPAEPPLRAVYMGETLIGHLHDQDPGGMRPARHCKNPDIPKCKLCPVPFV